MWTPIILLCSAATCGTLVPPLGPDVHETQAECEAYLPTFERDVVTSFILKNEQLPISTDLQCVSWGPQV